MVRISTAPISTIVPSLFTPASDRPFFNAWIEDEAEERADHRATAAEDRRAAEHDRGDGVELDAGAHVRARGRDARRRRSPPRPPPRGRRRSRSAILVASTRRPEKRAADLVRADGIGGAAPGGQPQDQRRGQRNEAEEPELGRHAEHLALAEHEEPVRIAAHRAGLAIRPRQCRGRARACRAWRSAAARGNG